MCPSTLIYDYPLSQENPGILVLQQAQLISASGGCLHLEFSPNLAFVGSLGFHKLFQGKD